MMKKRIFSIILAVIIMSLCLVSSAFATSDMKLTNEIYPTSIAKGNTFSIYGTITSSKNITSVVCGAYKSDGSAAFSYTAKPGKTSYNVHDIDKYMTFSKLTQGTYTYKIVASDSAQSNVTLLSKSFKVIVTSAGSSLSVSDAIYPSSVVVGNTFSIYGMVTSDHLITSVVCAVKSSSGTTQFSKSVSPNATSYSLHDIDNYMTFSKLAVGTYTYTVTASDTVQKDVVLLNKTFTVSTVVNSTLKVSNTVNPNRIVEGKTFSVYGIVSSQSKITSLTARVYNTSGVTQFSKTVSPGSTSYSIHSIDNYMTFSALKSGVYTYKVTATDATSTDYVIINERFAVVSESGAEALLDDVHYDVLDLSVWNVINSWSKLASQVDGVILRIGYRGTVNRIIMPDTKFSEYYKSAKAQNLNVGAYFFSNALTTAEAIEEADYVDSVLKANKCQLDMPIYIDMETDAQTNLGKSTCTAVAKAFCDRMKELGYYSGVYCSTYFAIDNLDRSKLSDYTFWIAHYSSCCSYTSSYGMWQYTDSGSNSGMPNAVDSNYCYYNYPKYIVANSLNGYTATKPTFEVKNSSGAVLNSSNNTIAKTKSGLTTAEFTAKYLTMSSNVSVTYTGTVDGVVATGTTITVKSGTSVLGTYTVLVLGDVDKNGKVNSTDALAVLKHTVLISTIDSLLLPCADYNGDGAINSADALMILKYSVGLL